MNVKSSLVTLFAVSAFISPQTGCGENAANPQDLASSNLQVADIKHLLWTLVAATEAGREVDLSPFPPFHLIYDDERFFGDDGCNSYGAKYEARNDSIFPAEISQTLRLCDVASFSVLHLAKPYRLHIAENELRIFSGAGVYSYKSEFTASISQSPIVRDWQLQSSTDPEFEEIQNQLLISTLLLDESRGFKIAWKCFPDNLLGCNEIMGVYGIGDNMEIRFYQTGSQLDSLEGFDFVQRILNALSYSVEIDSLKGGSLILTNAITATTYEFVAIQR